MRPTVVCALAALAALSLGVVGGPAPAQAPAAGMPVPPPVFDPQPVMPITQPRTLAISIVPSFRFAVELTNLGVPLPGGPGFALIEGAGWVARGPRTTTWQINIERMFLDGMQLVGAAPMVSITVNMDNAVPARRQYTADYRGLDSVPQTAPGSPVRGLVRIIADTAAYLVFMPLPQPIGDRSPVVDFSETFRLYLAKMVPTAQILRPPAPAFAVGQVLHRGRAGVLARQVDEFSVRMNFRDVTLRTEATGVIDAYTGLPLFVRARVSGPVDMPVMRGPLDFVARLAVSVEDMGNPIAALAPPPPPDPLPGGVTALQPRQLPAPAAPSQRQPVKAKPPATTPRPAAPVAQPPVAKPAEPKPAETKPAAPPSGRPEGPENVVRRLENLKLLYDRGLITKEQFEAKQKEILGAL